MCAKDTHGASDDGVASLVNCSDQNPQTTDEVENEGHKVEHKVLDKD